MLKSIHIEHGLAFNHVILAGQATQRGLTAVYPLQVFQDQLLTAREHRLACAMHRLYPGHRLPFAMDGSKGFDVSHIAAQSIKRPRIHQILWFLLCLTLLVSSLDKESQSQTLLVSFYLVRSTFEHGAKSNLSNFPLVSASVSDYRLKSPQNASMALPDTPVYRL